MSLFFCLVLVTGNAQTTSYIPPTHLNLPVLITIPTGGGEATGSGFLLKDKKTFWYFVTAKHVLLSRDPVKRVDTLLGKTAKLRILDSDPQDTSSHVLLLDLVAIQKDNRLLGHKSADVILVKLGASDSTNLWTLAGTHWISRGHNPIHIRTIDMLSNYAEVRIGNNIFVYGYPTSIGLQWMPQFDYNRPLLRKGIVAGKFEQTQTIILDSPSYFGTSGGPVIQESQEEIGTKFKIIGIVTELIPFDESILNKSVKPRMLFTNSGYTVIESADRILEILQTH